MSKKVWFALLVDNSPDNSSAEESPLFQYREFSELREDSQSTEGSDLSQYSFKQCTEASDLSQYSFKSPERSSLSSANFSEYSLPHRMEKNTTGETVSTNDSQDISSSQQESTVSDGYCYDDDNESSSLRDSPHEEVVNSAIMEVSGELMLGKLTPNKHPSVCSESSDISDDEMRHRVPGGSIAKYPESSTGLSDNDWNPYATESDTNQTPRSPRSNTSDENRVGFVSKANINVKAPLDRVQVTGEEKSIYDGINKDPVTEGHGGNGRYSPEQSRSDSEDIKQYATLLSEREDQERESPDTAPDTARSAYTEESRSGRQSSDSLRSEEYKRDSIDAQSVPSESESARHSLETGPLDSHRRISAESARSLSQDSADNSSQPSVETVRNVRGSYNDLDRGELNNSGRLSVDSYRSQGSEMSKKTDQSEHTQRVNPTPGHVQFDRSDKLDRLSHTAGDNLKELMQFESAQRSNSVRNGERDLRLSRDRMNYPVSSTRLTAKIERSPERSSLDYITIAERERLIADSPDHSKQPNPVERRSFELDRYTDFNERLKSVPSETKLPRVTDDAFGRSPSDVSMRRVSSLFEETKRQVREAVAIPRPDPSGSEERFPLRERLTLSQHDGSFISQARNRSEELDDKRGEKFEKPRESEAARSLTSEEVARVLSKYSEYEKDNSPKLAGDNNSDSGVKVSAFDSVDKGQNGTGSFDDELSQRVKAILADSHQFGNQKMTLRDTQPSNLDYVPNTIDYTRLHRDLEEIQDSLHDIPKTKANDSLPLHLRNGTDYQDSPIPPEFVIKSMETTSSAVTKSRESGISEFNGRESSASEYGRRLVWDHGADLQYDNDYDGKFLGTNTSTETMSRGRRGYGYEDSDTLVVRPDSVATNATENDVLDFESEGVRTLTGSDITRAERIVQQVMNRQAEGDLKENVEDIIARYRDERKDLDDRFQAGGDAIPIPEIDRRKPEMMPSVTPSTLPRCEAPKPVVNSVVKDNREVGLAERVYKILTAETDNPYERPDEQGDRSMVSTVSNILAKGRPQDQVNGILTETLAHENEMLKKIASRETTKQTDSSLDDSGVTEDSYALEDEDIRKRLQWSQMSSPEKGDKSYTSDLKALREVTTAPYSSLSNAKTLLSTQLKKMSERNFDKSVELRTPFRQTIQCWPVHGVENTGNQPSIAREAWMPQSGTSSLDREKKSLGSDRFYVTEKDNPTEIRRPRTFSDPFDISQSRHISDRDLHTRSRSEEAQDVNDLSQFSLLPHQFSPTNRRSASSPTSRRTVDEFMTPKRHKPEDARPVISPTDSDTSGSKRAARPRPYRPAGSRDMYYTESGDDTNESGTTIESTHPGSDDAIPPYIPRQYLGTRLDEPDKHQTGIYGVNNKNDDLSTIDENSVKDDKEKALTASTGSQKEDKVNRDEGRDRRSENGSKVSSNTQFAETGYQTGSSGRLPDTRNLETGIQARSRSAMDDLDKEKGYPSAAGGKEFTLKSREEYLQEFEEREQERRLRYAREHGDQMGTSVRSDPGSALEDQGPRWEYRESTDRNEFKVMEPEPGYPQDRLRYSRSRSDTDLAALSPAESQRYSSPMQPGTRFMELSTQPSPIFHQDSLTIAPRARANRDLGQEQGYTPVKHQAAELPHVDDRRPTPELPRVDDRRSSPSAVGRREPERRPVEPLELGEEPVRPLEAGNVNTRSKYDPRPQEVMEPVDIGADPRRLGDIPRSRRPRTPLYEKQKEMEAELEKMNKELSEQVKELKEGNKSEENIEDNAPMSKKAQVLREVLEQEYVEGIPPNINDMWTRFKETFDQSVSESSLNSTRLDALSGLIQNPTHHLVNSFLREKQQETQAQKKVCEENAEKIREERKKESERLKRMSEIRAVEERNERRREMRQKHGLSEEESNGSITELLVENEKKKKERSKKKEKQSEDAGSPKKRKTPEREKRERKGKKGQVDKETETQIKSRARVPKNAHSDSMDTLFSIPEDASFEQSPSKSESELRSRQRRQRHVIDPLMKKLRDKIKLQRVKIDKERRKELQRVEKLKKLEMLLNAKRSNHLSDKAIDVELQNVSSTTSINSETTVMSTDSTLNTLMLSSHGSDQSSDISTTLKDSTGTPIKLQVKRYPEWERGNPRRHYHDTDSTESSDFSNIIVEKLPASKSDRRKTDRKSGSKERKVRLDENGQRVRKEKRNSKKKSEVFGVEISDEDLNQQLKRYERYVSPQRRKQIRDDDSIDREVRRYERSVSPQRYRQQRDDDIVERQVKRNMRCVSPPRHKQLKDASTMYPSPITVSPPQRRRMRDVLMRSEAIQTSPSIRSSSPTYSYDEVPVAPVPTMSSIRSGNRSLRRRPSPSPPRSASARSSKTSPARKSSRSPQSRTSSRSPARGVSIGKTVSIAPPTFSSRQRREPAMWKPESESSPPPENSMFTPEGGENIKPVNKDEATTWFIPMKPSQPWRQPLKERQAFSVRQENWEPTSVTQKQWKKMIHGGVPKDQGDPNDVSRDTKFDLDPEGQPINEDSEDDSDDTNLDLSNSKPLSKMSLQEAFAIRKQMTISNLRRRQKRLNLAAEERKMEAYLKMERDRLFNEERKKEANPEAHPYSDNLYRPARRIISKEEMKELTVKRYKKLPEVLEKQKQKKREDAYSLNRIKARLFNRKIQKQVLVKADKWGR